MSTTQVSICNMALGEVAEQTITTLQDESTPARLCLQFFAQSVREALAEGLWKCARTRAVLTELSNAPLFGWSHAYQLPVDYIRTFTFNDTTCEEQLQELFEIQGNTLLTEETTVNLVYIRDLSREELDVNLMPPLLTKAVYLNLASKLAWPLQQSRTLKDKLEEDYMRAVMKAKMADSREDFRPTVNPASGSRWLNAHRS